MKNYPIWKSFTVISLVLLGIIFAIPSIIYDENSENWFLKNKINLGLDLQGGSYLLLEVQLDVLYKEELDNFADSVRLISREQSTKIEKLLFKKIMLWLHLKKSISNIFYLLFIAKKNNNLIFLNINFFNFYSLISGNQTNTIDKII